MMLNTHHVALRGGSFARCGKGFDSYDAAEKAARRRPRNDRGFMVWRCARCPQFHIGAFALSS